MFTADPFLDTLDPGGPGPVPDHRPTTLAALVMVRSELANMPKPEPMIEDTLDCGTVAVLAGSWGSGKSLQALDWAACVATGRPWQGRPTRRVKVLYVAAEGAYGLHDRLTSWESAWGLTVPSDMFSVLPLPVNLTKAGELVALEDEIARGEYGLIVIDTLARSIVGADENSAKDIGIVVDVLFRLQRASPNSTVLCVHHTGKDRKTIRGSSALESGVDAVYLMSKDEDEIILTRTKRKEGPEHDEHNLQIVPVSGTESVILNVRGDVRGVSRTDQLLSVFVSAFSETGASKADLRNAADLAPATFSRSLNNLVKDGYLVNIGTPKQPFYKAAP